MRRLFVGLLTLLVLGAGTSFAQVWAGVSGSLPFAVTGHVGFENGLGDGVDIRGNGTLLLGSTSGYLLGVDVILDLPVTPITAVDFYFGAGPGLALIDGGTAGVLLNTFVGAEYDLGGIGSAFLEGGATFEPFGNVDGVDLLSARLGINFSK